MCFYYSNVGLVLHLMNILVWILLFNMTLLFRCPQRPADCLWMFQILLADLPGQQAQHRGAVFHSIFLSPSACSLSTLFKSLEYIQDHLFIPWLLSSWLLRAALGTQVAWVSVSVPLMSNTFYAELKGFSRSGEHALSYIPRCLRVRLCSWGLSSGERKICAGEAGEFWLSWSCSPVSPSSWWII